jgi:hypothetical protein
MKRFLAVAIAAGALAVSACGSKSDEDQVKDVVKKVDDNPAALCDNATKDLLAQLGGKSACVQLAQANKDSSKSKVSDVKVSGDTATATVTDDSGPSQVTFQKVDGDWKIKSSK